jgi:superfamily II DNA/RNA helicase
MTFAELGLNPVILSSVTACGYTTPTPIQEQAIPLVMAGHDLIATARTGTGKTAAFVLPALERLAVRSTRPGNGPRILVLTPTRELASQVMEAARSYGKGMKLRCGAIVGGMPYREQFRLLAGPLDILVATPGRLVDHMARGSVNFNRLELLILDEADRMLDMGFSDDVDAIVTAAPKERQTLLFTATMDATLARLAQKMLTTPQRIELSGDQPAQELIEQRLHVTDNLRHKKELLRNLISDVDLTRAIIFSATKKDADELARELFEEGHAVAALHGDMNQNARNKTIARMKGGRLRLLVATDVAARGLDVTGVSHVINFDIPRFAEDYVHRIGRTGRAGVTGIAISFVSPSERAYLEKIERFIGTKVPVHTIPGLEPVTSLSRPASRTGFGRKSAPVSAGRSAKGFPSRNVVAGASARPQEKSWQARNERPAAHSGGGRPPVIVEYRSRRTQ